MPINNFAIIAENGFCSYETTHEGTRGVFLWNETEVNSIASSKCFYGPSNVTVTRLCAKRGMPTDVTVELCRTAISDNFTVIKHVLQVLFIYPIHYTFSCMLGSTDECHKSYCYHGSQQPHSDCHGNK